MELNEAKAFLQRKEAGGAGSVYDHLTEVLMKVIAEKPGDAVAALAAISAAVKTASLKPSPLGGGGAQGSAESRAARIAWASRMDTLVEPTVPAEGVSPAPVQDLTDEAAYLEWAGVSLGREESYRLHLSLKSLAATTVVRGLRLWGKILGTSADYIVAEGLTEPNAAAGAVDPAGNTVERAGEGANKFTYWVCAAPGEAWTRLPHVSPHQIVAAGAIRRTLTGRLGSLVPGHPPFPGTEAAYLRALIAQISSDTVLAPAGVYVPLEESATFEIGPNPEEFDAPALMERDSWVHAVLPLNALGRTAPNPAKLGPDGEPIEVPDAPEPPAVLKSIADEEGAWGLRPCPEPAPGEDASGAALVAVRSLKWPGAVSVGFGKRFANVYVGYGLAYKAAPHAVPPPAALAKEFDVREPEKEFGERPDVTVDPDAVKAVDPAADDVPPPEE